MGVPAVVFALAVAARLIPVVVRAGPSGLVGYDDGVYFGAAIALVQGVLPYRDILLLHPPGIVVLLAPFAALGGVVGDEAAFALARVGVAVLGGVNALLVWRVAGRHDPRAGVAAGLVYAVWVVAAGFQRSTDLHAPQDTLLLVALLAAGGPGRASGRRALAVGAALGLATSIQAWQAVSFLVLTGWLLVRGGPGGARRLRTAATSVTGAMAAGTIVCGPFLVASGASMVRQVALDQLGRPPMDIGVLTRLRALEGLPRPAQLPSSLRFLVPDAAVVLLAVAGVLLALALARRRPWTRPWVVLAGVQGAVVLAMPSFFTDYAAYTAAASSLVLGSLAGEAWRAAGGRVPVLVRRAVVGAAVLALATVTVPAGTLRPIPVEALRREVAGAGCVSASNPTLLVMSGGLRKDLEAGCPVVIDPGGVRYDTDRGRPRRATSPSPDYWRRWRPGTGAATSRS